MSIPEQYKDLTFLIDPMYINAIPFVIEIAGNIQYGSAQTIPDQTFKSI